MDDIIERAADMIRSAKYAVAFTGAGISVNSGIPTFRGEGGIWNEVDPNYFNLEFFHRKPALTWQIIKQVFYDKLTNVKPNKAHFVLSVMEQRATIKSIITQNIDHLHQDAGNKNVIELHGTYKRLICTKCSTEYGYRFADLNFLPPTCIVCRGILKPDFVFFNEPLPEEAINNAFEEVKKADLLLIIGTRAEVHPANTLPQIAKEKGAKIIEINVSKTLLTDYITDIFLKGDASNVMEQLCTLLTCEEH
ncbi:MAG: NAD-dependent deacylase [Bacteroidales bacterium]|nr:NAD-dependent deacylase [Bacteroidales bacterium]